jgi:hypothetical protein
MFHEKTYQSNLKKRQELSLSSRSELYSKSTSADSKFYEIETAVVLDVILDDTHPIFKGEGNAYSPIIDPLDHPGRVGKDEIDFSWIGRALVRMTNSERESSRESLSWAIPHDIAGEMPLLNEIVCVIKHFDQLYYQKLNTRNFINNNADFRYEKKYGLNDGIGKVGPISYTRNPELTDTNENFAGSLGLYFKSNDDIRSVKRNEGDRVIESRFGQSIRFNGFTGNSSVDSAGIYPSYAKGTGNPCIFIRNRQREINPSNKLEKNVGGYIEEDINKDGSSIQITSGRYVSKWDVNTISTKPFQVGVYKSKLFSPSGCTEFQFPKLDGDQTIIQSDRVIISARHNEMFLCSKYRFSIFTDSEYTVDAKDQIVLTTNKNFHINSPYIFMGDYGTTDQAIMLGTDTAKWLFDLIEWLKTHTHIYKHNHPKVGGSSPDKTQVTPQVRELIRLQNLIPSLISDRVYTSGRNKGTGTDISQQNNPPTTISNIAKG